MGFKQNMKKMGGARESAAENALSHWIEQADGWRAAFSQCLGVSELS
jgi:hypothetical protein